MSFFQCENADCIYWQSYGCTSEILLLDERGICRSYSPAAHALRLTEDPMVYRTDGDREQQEEDSQF